MIAAKQGTRLARLPPHVHSSPLGSPSFAMAQLGPAVLLGDTFPAKAYLIVAHLSAAAPSVCAFAPDGRSFEIYDQGTFARDHLPRFYKHANYGSFVRQLNLYGFTSSRRKVRAASVVVAPN